MAGFKLKKFKEKQVSEVESIVEIGRIQIKLKISEEKQTSDEGQKRTNQILVEALKIAQNC